MGQLEPLYLFGDEPVANMDSDRLSLESMAQVIAAAAIGAEGPFNIGVFGGWGHGKSSVMKLAKSLIDENTDMANAVTVWVNAWKYEHDEHPIVPLVACIVDAVNKRLAALQRMPDQDGTQGITEGFKRISRALRAIAYGFSAKVKVGIPGFTEIEAGFVAEKMIDRYEDLSATPRDPLLDKSLYYRADDLLASLPEKSSTERPPKIIVFIDDLDRCLPPRALRLFESIKLVLAHKGFIFVMAVDRNIIDSFLEARYSKEYGLDKYANDGARYMDKLIQLPLMLPDHANDKFETFIEKLIESHSKHLNPGVEKAFISLKGPLAAGVNRNPRTLIRTLNRLLVDTFMWFQSSPEKDKEQDYGQVVGLCAVTRILENNLTIHYRGLAHDQELCDLLRKVLGSLRSHRTSLFKADGVNSDEIDELKSKPVILDLDRYDFLKELLRTEYGIEWLKNSEMRSQFESILVHDMDAESYKRKEVSVLVDRVLGLSKHNNDPLNPSDYASGTISNIKSLISRGVYERELFTDRFIELLESENSNTATKAIVALGEIGGEQVVQPLINCLASGSSILALNAIVALGKIGGEQVTQTLISCLESQSPGIAQCAIRALGEIGDEQAAQALIECLNFKSTDIVSCAISALGQIGGEQAVQALIKCLDFTPTNIVVCAIRALGEIGGEEATKALIKCLNSKSTDIVAFAISALVDIGGEEAAKALIKCLNSKSTDIVACAISALGQIGGEAVQALIKCLDSEYPDIVEYAISALKKIGSEQATEALMRHYSLEELSNG